MQALTEAQLIDQVNLTICKLFELTPEQLSPEKHLFTDLDLDSLDAIDLMLHCQREFGVKPETQELQAIRRLQDVYDLVFRYYAKKQEPIGLKSKDAQPLSEL